MRIKMNEELAKKLNRHLEEIGIVAYMQLPKEQKMLIVEGLIFSTLSDKSKATISRAMSELGKEFMTVFCYACGMEDSTETEIQYQIEQIFLIASDDLKEELLTKLGVANQDEVVSEIMANTAPNKYGEWIDSISKCLPDEIKYFFSKMISQEGENAVLAFLSDICNQKGIGSYGGNDSQSHSGR